MASANELGNALISLLDEDFLPETWLHFAGSEAVVRSGKLHARSGA